MKIHIILPICLLILGTVSMAAGMDDADLKDWLVNNFLGYEGLSREDADDFKKRFAVKDEQFHRVLMDIYHEAENSRAALAPGTQEWEDSQRIESGLIELLPLCFHPQVKDFLKNYVDLKAIDSIARGRAVLSYLIVANAEESKNILLRFLVGEDRMDEYARSSIYRYPMLAWDAASPEKKAAMFNALCEAAAMESVQWAFDECDSQLIAMYAGYKDSPLRAAMLQRQLSMPFPQYYDELKDKMAREVKRFGKMKHHSRVSTNGLPLTAHDFNLSSSGPQTDGIGPGNADGQSAPASGSRDILRPAVPLVVGAGLIGAFSLWRVLRKKKP